LDRILEACGNKLAAQDGVEADGVSFEAFSLLAAGAGKARRLTASRRRAVETPKYR